MKRLRFCALLKLNALLLSSVWWNTYFYKRYKGCTCKNQKSISFHRFYFSPHRSSCQNVRILCLVPLRADSLKSDKQISFYFIANNISLFSPIFFMHVPSFSITLISVLLLFFPSFLISPCKATSPSPFWFPFFILTFTSVCSFFLQLTSFPISVIDLLLLRRILHSHVAAVTRGT